MTRRPTPTAKARTIRSPQVDDPTAARGDRLPAVTEDHRLTGIVGDASATAGESRSGEDTRRRGWFWHWNSIVTQFAPIIGLKGVGLLNSYTVWTDRREESPHRGFAFPSQQSEADFYGEDRNELITINKILVALDLIEIRKHMVSRTDAAGRRWRVPHNLYRVKDHGDDFTLTTDDVRRIVTLAQNDRAVYRYVKRIFSPRFSPIDSTNVWHDILEELRPTPEWQELAARTEATEDRASRRSQKGHASRKTGPSRPRASSDTPTAVSTASGSSVDSPTVASGDSSTSHLTSAALFNSGLDVDAAQSNNGFGDPATRDVGLTNTGRQTTVQPTSTTYNQRITTTSDVPIFVKNSDSMVTNGPGGTPPPTDQETTVRLFEEANDKPATQAQKRHLRNIASDFADVAQRIDRSGWALVGLAIDEAVAAGSSFVAPRRIREILARWRRDGIPADIARPAHPRDIPARDDEAAVTASLEFSHRTDRWQLDDDPAQVWARACESLKGSIRADARHRMQQEATLVGYDDGTVAIVTSAPDLAERMGNDWQSAIERKLSVIIRKPVRISVTQTGTAANDAVPTPDTPGDAFPIPEARMLSSQLWTAVMDHLRAADAVPRSEMDNWLRDARILDRADDGDVFVIGLPSPFAQRRAERFRDAIENALVSAVGFDVEVRFVRTATWLAQDTERSAG